MTNYGPVLRRSAHSRPISLALGLLALTVLVSTIVLAVLILLQIEKLSEGVERSQQIVNSDMRSFSQAQREILRLIALLERDEMTAEPLELLRSFISQRTQEASLVYQIQTLGSEELYEVSLELRDRWLNDVEPLVRQIIADPAAASPQLIESAIQQLQALELGYNRQVADGEINRRIQGVALNSAAEETLEATRSVIVVLGLSALAFISLAAVAGFYFARLAAQRENAARALMEANRNLQTLSAVASRTRNIVIVADAEGNISWVNNAFINSTGYTLEEARGKKPGDLLQGRDSNPETIRYMNERLMSGQGFEAEMINYTKGGQTYWIAIEVQPVLDEQGKLTNYVALETDITARKQTEAALRAALEQEREARELKSRFVSMTSHELRTPLTTILTLSDFLKMADSNLTPTQRAERLSKIETAARQISALVDDVLHYDRTDTTWLQFSPQPVVFNEFVRGLVEEMSADVHHIYRCSLPQQPVMINGDPPLLRQIVLNLLTNAAKYSPHTETIEVQVAVEDASAVLTVRDHGIGIPVAEHKHIFEPFYRAANTGGVAGTGLGLPITRNSVELHGGTITFESGEGKGTVFTVRLPLALEQGNPGMTRILVIEDDTAIRDTVTDILEFAGYTVLKASNGIIGLEVAQTELPDLILCDIMLPGLDGYGIKLALNNAPQVSSIPFIFITARAAREDVRQGMTLGADDYLTKPFSSRELLDVVATRIARYQQIAVSRVTDLESLREYINLTLPHELRTPLTSILGYLAMARDGVGTLDSEAMRDMLDRTERSAMRLHHLVERYVAYAQLRLISANPEVIAALREVGEDMPLGLLLRHVADGQAEMTGRRADLEIDLQAGSAVIVGEHFERLITVLLENAFKFSEPGTPVTVVSRAQPPSYVITIRDRGRGMTAEQIRQVGANVQFERRTYEQQGVGLGLAIANQIVEIYGGRLLLESAPGEGTTAHLELPLQ